MSATLEERAKFSAKLAAIAEGDGRLEEVFLALGDAVQCFADQHGSPVAADQTLAALIERARVAKRYRELTMAFLEEIETSFGAPGLPPDTAANVIPFPKPLS